jgi:hypothetical protein
MRFSTGTAVCAQAEAVRAAAGKISGKDLLEIDLFSTQFLRCRRSNLFCASGAATRKATR